MTFEAYIGKTVLDNAEDIVLKDVDIIEDDGDALNIFFVPEEFEDEPGRQLKTGVIIMYDINRVVTDIVSTAHIYEKGQRPVEADPETCEDEELIRIALDGVLA